MLQAGYIVANNSCEKRSKAVAVLSVLPILQIYKDVFVFGYVRLFFVSSLLYTFFYYSALDQYRRTFQVSQQKKLRHRHLSLAKLLLMETLYKSDTTSQDHTSFSQQLLLLLLTSSLVHRSVTQV